jgi:hypothetical protein
MCLCGLTRFRLHPKNPNEGSTYQPRVETLRVLRFYPGFTSPKIYATLKVVASPHILRRSHCSRPVNKFTTRRWLEFYEQSRLMAKAGQRAKQGAPSASKVATRRVDTKRRR